MKVIYARVPDGLHDALIKAAAELGWSLNQVVNEILARAAGSRTAQIDQALARVQKSRR
jgi:HicB family